MEEKNYAMPRIGEKALSISPLITMEVGSYYSVILLILHRYVLRNL